MRTCWRLFALLCSLAAWDAAQTPQPGPPQIRSQTAPPVPGPGMAGPAPAQNQFSGGVPAGQATPGVMRLTLADAIQRGLRQNLGLLLNQQATRLAEGARLRARAPLLPNLVSEVSETGEQINLKALGFSGFPGIPTVVGPFNVFDARVSLSQEVLNFSDRASARAGAAGLRAARYSFQDTRDIVVLVVANLYLQAVAGQARIGAVQAQVNTAKALYDRAVDMKNAGMVAGIDVLRAQVELQAQRQRLIFFQNEFEKQKLALGRAIGLPLGQAFELADQAPYAPAPALSFEQALETAYKSRADYHSAQEQVTAAQETRRAAVAERLPSVSFAGNYGAIGPRPWDSHGTFTVAGTLRIPIYQGGRVDADIEQAGAQLEQRKAALEDLRAGINYEVRTAFLDLKAAGDQVQVAQSAQGLAGEQLKQAQDRFGAGVANNIEVVQAQEALATANENYISSLYAFNLAKASLARAVGQAAELATRFLAR